MDSGCAAVVNKPLIVRGKELFPPVALAPMVGLSHTGLRSLVHEFGGVGLFYTEMLAAKRLPHDNPLISPLLITSPAERPLYYQLVTASTQHLERAIDKLHNLGADGVDLNLGCPAPNVKREGAGGALALDHDKVAAIIGCLRERTELPITVKIRLGEPGGMPQQLELCRILEGEGVDLITVHARYHREKFCRKPRWSEVVTLKKQVSVPLMVNGGIFSVEDAKLCLAESGADGIMLGRGAAVRPWLAAEIAEELYGIPQLQQQPICFKQIFERFADLLEERFAPERRLGRLKQFTSYYSQGITFGHHLAAAVQSSKSMEEARARGCSFFDANQAVL